MSILAKYILSKIEQSPILIEMKKNYIPFSYITFICISVFFACKSDSNQQNTNNTIENEPSLFTLLPTDKTHVDFQNTINEGLNTNVLMYEYFYNGGGVAVGDINNDGLDDIYFTSNMQSNRLYFNKGKYDI